MRKKVTVVLKRLETLGEPINGHRDYFKVMSVTNSLEPKVGDALNPIEAQVLIADPHVEAKVTA